MYKPGFQKVDLIDERNLEALNIDDNIKPWAGWGDLGCECGTLPLFSVVG